MTSSQPATPQPQSQPQSQPRPRQKQVPQRFILARYTGDFAVQLKGGMRVYRGADNLPIKPHRRLNPTTGRLEPVTLLQPGDVLMMPEIEVRGQTLLIDPTGNAPALWLGVGFKPLPEHVGLSMQEVAGMRCKAPDGIWRFYELHEGRPDFTPVDEEQQSGPPPEEPVPPAASEPQRSQRRSIQADTGPSSSAAAATPDDPEQDAGDE